MGDILRNKLINVTYTLHQVRYMWHPCMSYYNKNEPGKLSSSCTEYIMCVVTILMQKLSIFLQNNLKFQMNRIIDLDILLLESHDAAFKTVNLIFFSMQFF